MTAIPSALPIPTPVRRALGPRTRNLVDEVDIEAGALAHLREVQHAYGEESASGYAHGVQDLDNRRGRAIAQGMALVELNRATEAASSDGSR